MHTDCYTSMDTICNHNIPIHLVKPWRLCTSAITSYHMVVCGFYMFYTSLIWFHRSICHIIFQFKLLLLFHWSIRQILFQFNLLVLFHWSICHILFQFNLLTLQSIHLLIHYNCLLLFLCVWCWLRAVSLLFPPADTDIDQCTTHSTSNECHQ